jgi:hypothetical protein
MEQFFDALFKPSRAVKHADGYALFVAPLIWLVTLPWLLRISGELSTIGVRISSVKLAIVVLVIIWAYVFSMGSLYRLLFRGTETMQFSVVISFLPYVFSVFSLLAGDYAILVLILLSVWSGAIELLAVHEHSSRNPRGSVYVSLIIKLLRVSVFFWLVSSWWSI